MGPAAALAIPELIQALQNNYPRFEHMPFSLLAQSATGPNPLSQRSLSGCGMPIQLCGALQLSPLML